MSNISHIRLIYQIDNQNINPDNIILIPIKTTGLLTPQYERFNPPDENEIKLRKTVKQKLKTLTNLKCLIVSDIHPYTFQGGYDQLANYCQDVGITHICTRFVNSQSKQLNYLLNNITFINVPRPIDSQIFQDYHLDKIYDILYYGASDPNIYPFRNRLKKLLLSPQCKQFKIKIIDPNHNIKGIELAKNINQSWLTIATPSSFDYLVDKYLEIPASNSVVLGNMATSGHHIFSNNYININNDMTDEIIIQIIQKSLQNKQDLLNKMQIMYDLIHLNYNLQSYDKNISAAIRAHTPSSH